MMEESLIQVIRMSRTRQSETILVAIDANKDDNDFAALNWVLSNLVRSGHRMVVMAIIFYEKERQVQHGCWPFARDTQPLPVSEADITTFQHLHDEISKKRESYKQSLRTFYEQCNSKAVKMEFKIAAGFHPTCVTMQVANSAKASWIVLARSLKKYKNDIADKSGCNVAVITRNNIARIVTSENQSNLQFQKTPSIDRDDLHLTDEFKLVASAVQNPLGSEEKTPVCSVCENKLLANTKSSSPREFSMDEITKLTNDFSQECFLMGNEIWQLYKGTVQDGSSEIEVLVKKFEVVYFETVFKTEIDILSVARHQNILTLVGICKEKSSPALVYECACNGSLDRYLSPENEVVLTWQERRRIAIGVGQGLRYLNENWGDATIVHRDIQPSNILITHDFSPLISNFGSARRLRTDEICRESKILGAAGYVAPECADRGLLSVKADAYSFGVLLLELISGRKALDFSQAEEQCSLVEWARPLIDTGAFHELIDGRLMDSVDMYELYSMISAASVCIRKDPRSRYSMSQVVSILNDEPWPIVL